MKTLLLIIVTLMVGQILHDEYGPRNPVAKFSQAAVGSVRWLLHRSLDVVE